MLTNDIMQVYVQKHLPAHLAEVKEEQKQVKEVEEGRVFSAVYKMRHLIYMEHDIYCSIANLPSDSFYLPSLIDKNSVSKFVHRNEVWFLVSSCASKWHCESFSRRISDRYARYGVWVDEVYVDTDSASGDSYNKNILIKFSLDEIMRHYNDFINKTGPYEPHTYSNTK